MCWTCTHLAITAAVPTTGSGYLTCAPKEQEKKNIRLLKRCFATSRKTRALLVSNKAENLNREVALNLDRELDLERALDLDLHRQLDE